MIKTPDYGPGGGGAREKLGIFVNPRNMKKI